MTAPISRKIQPMRFSGCRETITAPSRENDTGSTIPTGCASWNEWIRERSSMSSAMHAAAPASPRAHSAHGSQ